MLRLMLLFACFVLLSVSSADALRCGPRLITKGAYKPEVLHKCGEPEFIEEFLLYDTVFLHPHTHQRRIHAHRVPIHGTHGGYEIPAGHTLLTTPVRVEDWTYNFGPNRLMQRLRFINGKVHEIDTMGYGY
ncbi:MAG: DUF2845 domain-containing protein [Candidatus Tectomicrobia bacterium]|nr:DUF2845 domain-containing protein [Candidatus Tectomicrobia bacterium]